MKSFQELDSLLHTAYDNLNKQEEDYAYLSSKNILKDITDKDKSIVKLDNLKRLEEKLQLSSLEVNIILILFALEVDSKYERIYAYIQDNLNLTYVTVHLLNALLCTTEEETESLYDYFIVPSKLTILNMISFSSDNTLDTLFKKSISLSASVRNYLLGDIYLQGTLAEYCTIIEPNEGNDNPLNTQYKIEEKIDQSERYLINIYGSSKKRKKSKALKIASHFNFGLLHVDVAMAIRKEIPFEKLLSSLLRDALLTGTLLYFESFDDYLGAEGINELKFMNELGRLSWVVLFSTAMAWNPKEIPDALHFYSFEHSKEDSSYLKKYWQETLVKYGDDLATQLSNTLGNTFGFSEEDIDNVIKYLDTESKLGNMIDAEKILQACRSRITTQLDQYAQKILTSNTFDDIVLPSKQLDELQEIIVHYRYQNKIFQDWGYEHFFQSRGIGILLTGSSGTGKTMAASIIANTLGLELYRIDLSKMISKYIGDTEKQLSQLFDMAKKSGVVLFFDEADSVFGKRSKVQNAHDRYANVEVSYLLQKIEEYEGIVILASNFKENIDEAFLRRLRFAIEFPTPNEEQRKLLWVRLFPKRLLEKDINFTPFAKKFKLSGANIRNVALYAAFNAVGNDAKIGIEHIVKSLKGELDKIGVGYVEDDFKELHRDEA